MVLRNPELDETHVISSDHRLPFEDNTYDPVFSDWVLERFRRRTSSCARCIEC